jgi:hypothetical protein
MRTKFEGMTVAQVNAQAASEGPVQRGKPLYADRSWTQLHNEMLDAGVATVGDLPRARIRVLQAATKAQAASYEASRRAR